MENVLMVLFEVESEAYQALAELRHDAVNSSYTISQMGLVRRLDRRAFGNIRRPHWHAVHR